MLWQDRTDRPAHKTNKDSTERHIVFYLGSVLHCPTRDSSLNPCLLPFIPSNAIVESHTVSPEAVQRTSYREVHLPSAQLLHQLEIFKVPCTAGVSNGDAAPLCQLLNQGLIDAFLQPLVVCRVDEKLGAVRLQTRDRLCREGIG